MTRKEFLELLGITTAVTCLGCSKNPMVFPNAQNTNPSQQDLTHGQEYQGIDTQDLRQPSINPNGQFIPPPTPKVDFTITLSQPQFKPLANVGGYAYYKGVIIARIDTSQYIAAAEYCSHNGITIEYNLAQTRYECPAHGSQFSNDGKVLIGPAYKDIKVYKTELKGQQLRIFEEQ